MPTTWWCTSTPCARRTPFLPANLRRGNVASPSERGDLLAEIRAYLDAGVDGFFTDDPAVGRAAVAAQKR